MKKRKENLIIALAFFVIGAFMLFSAVKTPGQSTTELSRRCAGNTPKFAFAKVTVEKDGDINIVPCDGKGFLINGIPLPGSGTVSSVGLSLPTIFSVSNSPVTTTGTLTATLASQTQKLFFAAPNGGNGTPTFRAILPSDLGIGTTDSSTFLRGDGSWQSVSSGLSGTGTANKFPYFTGSSALGDSPYSWNGTQYAWNNTAQNSTFTMNFTPSSSNGLFTAGSTNNFVQVNEAGSLVRLKADSSAGIAQMLGGGSTIEASNGSINLSVNASSFISVVGSSASLTSPSVFANGNTFAFNDATLTNMATFNLTGVRSYQLQRTITPSGTTGAQTINKPAFSVNFAASASSLVVTNSTVTTTTKFLCTVQKADSTMKSVSAVAASGSVTLYPNSAPTAETEVYCEARN